MMKRLSLLLLCAALAGAANALNVTWEDYVAPGDWDNPKNWTGDSTNFSFDSNNRFGWNSYADRRIGGGEKSFVVSATFSGLSLKDTVSADTLAVAFDIYHAANGGQNYGVAYDAGQGSWALWQKAQSEEGQGTFLEAATKVSLEDVGDTLKISVFYDAEANTLSFAINDILLGVFEDVHLEEGNNFNFNYGGASGRQNLLSGLYDNVSEPDIQASANLALLPEPTALALLALGVSALALRRRAA